jgi:hypothetical protein
LSAAIQLLLPGSIISSAIVAGILGRGIETDQYDPLPSVNVLDAGRAVNNVAASQIPAGAGIATDDTQPFPVFGWIEAKWQTQLVAHQ